MRLSSDSVVNSPPPLSRLVTSGSSSDLSWRRARLAAAFACLARSRSRLSKVVRRVANGTPSPDRERTAGTQYQRPPQAPGEHVVARPEHRTQRMLHLQCTRFAHGGGIRGPMSPRIAPSARFLGVIRPS